MMASKRIKYIRINIEKISIYKFYYFYGYRATIHFINFLLDWPLEICFSINLYFLSNSLNFGIKLLLFCSHPISICKMYIADLSFLILLISVFLLHLSGLIFIKFFFSKKWFFVSLIFFSMGFLSILLIHGLYFLFKPL